MREGAGRRQWAQVSWALSGLRMMTPTVALMVKGETKTPMKAGLREEEREKRELCCKGGFLKGKVRHFCGRSTKNNESCGSSKFSLVTKTIEIIKKKKRKDSKYASMANADVEESTEITE